MEEVTFTTPKLLNVYRKVKQMDLTCHELCTLMIILEILDQLSNIHHSTSGDCTKLHPAWFYMTTETTFPVVPGNVITVKCLDGFSNQGSETITCQNGIHYKFNIEPRCEATGMIFKTSFDMKKSHT